MTTPRILATCSGWRPSDRADLAFSPLQQHAVDLAGVTGRAPRIVYIGTAGGDQRSVESQELEGARLAGAQARHLRLFGRTAEPLAEIVDWADVIWVGGGSVVNLLAVWRAHRLPELLRGAWLDGTVLAGTSAGAICWHTGGPTSSFGPGIDIATDALGFVPGSLAVHYDSQPARRPAYEAAIRDGVLAPGLALEEQTGVLYEGTSAVAFLTETPEAAVTRVDAGGSERLASTLLR